MASSKSCFLVLTLLAFSLAISVQPILGEVVCEKLNEGTCAFAVSHEGKRCILEKHVRLRTGGEEYTCRTSEIEAEKLSDVIETDTCVDACGIDRKTIGISSDSLLESRFTRQLCSGRCYNNCPNVVDLYFNLAAGEGVFLPKLCEERLTGNTRREMGELRSSGAGKIAVAPGPIHSAELSFAPLPSPLIAQPPYNF